MLMAAVLNWFSASACTQRGRLWLHDTIYQMLWYMSSCFWTMNSMQVHSRTHTHIFKFIKTKLIGLIELFVLLLSFSFATETIFLLLMSKKPRYDGFFGESSTYPNFPHIFPRFLIPFSPDSSFPPPRFPFTRDTLSSPVFYFSIWLWTCFFSNDLRTSYLPMSSWHTPSHTHGPEQTHCWLLVKGLGTIFTPNGEELSCASISHSQYTGHKHHLAVQ